MHSALSANDNDSLHLYGQSFSSRLLLGTAAYPSPHVLEQAVLAGKPAMLTAALRRQSAQDPHSGKEFWALLNKLNIPILPNTAGCHTIDEVITTAMMARELFETEWIKLELIGDDYTLQPHTLELVDAAKKLLKEGFKVLPYCTEDLILCQRLVDVGCEVIMPWAAPIGSGKGPINPYALRLLRDRLQVPLLIDAGLGQPSHACTVMEWGYDGVLLNTAVAQARNPIQLATAFSQAVIAGRLAFLGGAIEAQETAQASTPTLGTPFWHQP